MAGDGQAKEFTGNRDARTMVDLFGRLSNVVVDESGNLSNPTYREGLIKSPEDWKAWDKRPLLRLPEKIRLRLRSSPSS